MSRPVFVWLPDLGASKSTLPNVTATKFGDGYELRVARGINSTPSSWSVTFTKGSQEAMEILDFLEARAALEAFEWRDPLDKVGSYVCREWNASQSMFGVYSVSATFEQVYEY